ECRVCHSSSPLCHVNSSAVLEFKSAALYALRLVLRHHRTEELLEALSARIHEAGELFRDEPVVIDAQALEAAPDWSALTARLQEHGLIPLGVSAPSSLQESVAAAGLAVLHLQGPR